MTFDIGFYSVFYALLFSVLFTRSLTSCGLLLGLLIFVRESVISFYLKKPSFLTQKFIKIFILKETIFCSLFYILPFWNDVRDFVIVTGFIFFCLNSVYDYSCVLYFDKCNWRITVELLVRNFLTNLSNVHLMYYLNIISDRKKNVIFTIYIANTCTEHYSNYSLRTQIKS